MFDDRFKRSGQDFTILQMLRIIYYWITTSMVDFRYCIEKLSLERDFTFHQSSYQALRLNWEALASNQQKMGKLLLDRIDRKTKEVESLRNGVCYCPKVPFFFILL